MWDSSARGALAQVHRRVRISLSVGVLPRLPCRTSEPKFHTSVQTIFTTDGRTEGRVCIHSTNNFCCTTSRQTKSALVEQSGVTERICLDCLEVNHCFGYESPGVFAFNSSSTTPAKPPRRPTVRIDTEETSQSPSSARSSDPSSPADSRDLKTSRSRTFVDIFKVRQTGHKTPKRDKEEDSAGSESLSAESESPILRDDSRSSRSKHVPIVVQGHVSPLESKRTRRTSTEHIIYTLPKIATSTGLGIPDLSPTHRRSSPGHRGPHRHVEIVIPPLKHDHGLHTTTKSPEERIDSAVTVFPNLAKDSSPPGLAQNKNMAASSRTSTLDSSTSQPSPNQLHSRNGGLRMNSSQTSLNKRDGYESNSEHEQDGLYGTQRATPQQLSSTALSPVAASSGNGASNLAGLVCNVHRTTGKEPHALVGATTTILGDMLYVFGGRRISRSRPSLTSDLYQLDLLRRHWTKLEPKGDIPPPRYFHSMCALGDNKLVCYGGMSPDVNPDQQAPNQQGEQPDPQVSVMSDVHIYDIPTRTWMKVHVPDTPQGRYAHCAAILPSSAVFASANAPMSAIQHNPAGSAPNQGSLGVSLDGTGGAEMVIVGGQDSANHYIEQISVFNLRSLKWTSTKPMVGRSCGAYRSVVTPLTSMSAVQIGAGPGRCEEEDEDVDDEYEATLSGSPMLIYTNYNFLDVKLELQVRLADGTLTDKPMQGTVSPPGLRFPSGGIIDNNFVVAGTFLTSSKQEYALWALDLRTLTWARVDTGSNVFSQGSWNRGVLWNRRNAFVILGNRKRNLVDDYNNRRLNFSNICLVQLEAFGLYDNPRKASPTSDYRSMSAPISDLAHRNLNPLAARQLSQAGVELGELYLQSKDFADMDFLSIDGTRLPVNSRVVARRWGPSFNNLLQEGVSSIGGTDTATLRPGAASIMSRNSSITITPSVGTSYSNATTLTANSGNTATTTASTNDANFEPPDARSLPPSSRPRILYLPHTYPTLQILVYYLYTSQLPALSSGQVTPQILCSLLQLARPYKIDGLVEMIVERLHETLDGRNAAAMFNAAAMGAGGGEGVTFAAENATTHAHPPRTASLAGINIDGLNLNNAGSSHRGTLRIDTDMANDLQRRHSNRKTMRTESRLGMDGHIDEDDEIPASASTTNSMGSQLSLARRGSRREDRQIWEGGWSPVIGLQKRGLRGLMEGRRIRERVRADTVSGPAPGESTRVGLGIA